MLTSPAARGLRGLDPVGTARALLAVSLLSTLFTTSDAVLFQPLVGVPAGPTCKSVTAASVWCLAPGLEVARGLSVLVLVAVAAGWQPRWTCVPHWYISWSFIASSHLQDGGDQVVAVLSFLLVPVALCDPRRWHWRPSPAEKGVTASTVTHVALWLVRLQVAFLYAEAGLAKLGQPDWANGTAMYYWASDATFGFPDVLQPLVQPVLHHPLGVVLATFGPIALEVGIAVGGLFGSTAVRHRLLAAGMVFHLAIAVLMGLASFAIAMWAALLLLMLAVPAPPSRTRLPAQRSAADTTPAGRATAPDPPWTAPSARTR